MNKFIAFGADPFDDKAFWTVPSPPNVSHPFKHLKSYCEAKK